MTESQPTWTAFDAHVPPDLPEGDGRVVVVAAAEGAETWAPALAVDLARAWGRGGRRVVLFDGGISAPTLHAVLGRENDEGLTDAVAYGASVGRVARRVEGEPLFFVPAGTAVADPRAILEHPRWTGMCRGFLEAGATLVMFLPPDEPGAEPALVDATDLVVLAPRGSELAGPVAAYRGKVRAILGPGTTGVADPAVPTAPPAPAALPPSGPSGSDPQADAPGVGHAGSEPDDPADASSPADAVADGADDLLVESPTEFEFPADAEPAFDLSAVDAGEAADAGPGSGPGAAAPPAGAGASGSAPGDGAAFWDEPWADDDLDADVDPGGDAPSWDLVPDPDAEVPDPDADVHALEADADVPGRTADAPAGASSVEEGRADGPASEAGTPPDVADGAPARATAAAEGDADEGPGSEESGAESVGEAALAFGGPESGAPNVDVDVDHDSAGSGDAALPDASDPPAASWPSVPTADEILAEAGEPAPQAASSRPTPERVAAGLHRRDSGGGGRTALLTAILVVLVVVAAVAWWLGLLDIPGLGASSTSGTIDAGAVTLAAAEAPPTVPAPPQPVPAGGAFSVALEAHRDPVVAAARAQAFRSRASDHLWLTAPVLVDGVEFHRVLVGPAADPVEAADLAHAVGAATGLDASSWLVRATPRAFLLHEDLDRAAASERAERLAAGGIPAYVLVVDYTDGSRRWRVYAGAYADADEASHLRGLLEERGLPAVLSERIGRQP